VSEQPLSNLGERLPDNVVVYRAFAEKNFRTRPDKVRYFAYLLREEDIQDGVSVGLTPEASVKYLTRNEGYCSILVEEIHGVGHGIEVRRDKRDPDHAYICNLPFQKISDSSRENAQFIGRRLAEKSKVVTCDSYYPTPKGQEEAPTPGV
jgi:hypothetical protein